MSQGARRWILILSMAMVAGGLLWGGWRVWQTRRDRRALAEIREAMQSGLNGTAMRKLIAYLSARPDSDEAIYLLGSCEMARGRARQAAEAWARVPPDSRFAARAIIGRMQIQMGRGRQAEAEQLLKDSLDNPRTDTSSLPILLGPIYCQQGRLEEAQQLIEARWNRLNDAGEGASEPAIELVRLYIELRRRPVPVEMVRSALDEAARLAPEDDRVWLGKANLAIGLGSHDEAARWIEACLRRRPEDIPVWRARLDGAVASHRVAEAMEALKHLPVTSASRALLPRLAVWLATRRGDLDAERRALERLITVAPGDFAALDRLAELSIQQGQTARAAELERQKAETEQLQARYQKLYQRNQPRRDAAEMARLAEDLGHWFEARAFWTVAAAADPDRDDLRHSLASLERRASAIDEAGRTLSDALAAELEAVGLSPVPASPPAVR